MIRNIGYLKVLKTGPGTSIQDSGRSGFVSYGVPISGALDLRSLIWVNHVLRNQIDDAVMEVCQPGLMIHFDAPTFICIAGAKAEVKLNGNLISSFGIVKIRANDQLEIGAFHYGSVLYLGVKNGFQSEKIMNSRSWFQGITSEIFAKNGDQIPYYTNYEIPKPTASRPKWDFRWAQDKRIEVYPGSEWGLLDIENQESLKSKEFTISNLKNRMAIQLIELLPNSLAEMSTAPVFPGTVQVTSGGKLIVLMKDAQVTGGYPRILQVSEEGLAILAQTKPHQKIRFQF